MIRRPALLLLVVLLAACGASARTKALQTQLLAVNVARDTLVAVSEKRQAQLVESAVSVDDGKAKLAAFRKAREPVVEAFEKAYRAIAAAALIDDASSVTEIAAAVMNAVTLVKELAK